MSGSSLDKKKLHSLQYTDLSCASIMRKSRGSSSSLSVIDGDWNRVQIDIDRLSLNGY